MEIITIIILFLFCTLLLAAELFILPGTGVAGIAAICCLVGANYFTFVWFGLTTGLWLSAASLVACILVGYWMLRSKTLGKIFVAQVHRLHRRHTGSTFRTARRRRSSRHPPGPHRQCRHRRPVGGSQICRRFSGRRYSRNSGSRRGCPNHSQKEINILFTL